MPSFHKILIITDPTNNDFVAKSNHSNNPEIEYEKFLIFLDNKVAAKLNPDNGIISNLIS